MSFFNESVKLTEEMLLEGQIGMSDQNKNKFYFRAFDGTKKIFIKKIKEQNLDKAFYVLNKIDLKDKKTNPDLKNRLDSAKLFTFEVNPLFKFNPGTKKFKYTINLTESFSFVALSVSPSERKRIFKSITDIRKIKTIEPGLAKYENGEFKLIKPSIVQISFGSGE